MAWALFGLTAGSPLLAGADPGTKPASNSTSKNDGAGLIVEGERFTVRRIIDSQQGGLVVSGFSAPEKWKDKSQVVWNYQNNSSPVQIGASAENPANEEAFFLFPVVGCFSLRPDSNYYRPGQNLGGLIFFHQPMSPSQALAGFVQQVRTGLPKLQLVGLKDLPDLAKALNYPMWGNDHGVGAKITYELNGKPVEEEFYAVAYSVDIPYDGPQGRTWQINWGLRSLHSFRAPQSTLDHRRNIFAAIAKSFRPNPAWQQRLAAINAYLAEQFNQQLQAGYDSIAAAARLSKQISANNDAMLASIDRQLAASRSSGTATTAGRSSTDKFDDYIRGVETVDDPYWGTSQHSFNEQYHWTDGYGNYRHSNEATYNPNQHENGDWQLMQPTR
jgi:hypothetical protein